MPRIFPHAVSMVAVAAFAAAALGVSVTQPTGASDEKVIKIAIDLPFSGTAGNTVTSMAEAFELAVKEADDAGLPGGFHLEAVRFDHGHPGLSFDANVAGQNARDNVADPQIISVFGPFNSTAAKAEIPILNAVGIAMVSASNTNAGLTKGSSAEQLRTAQPDANNYFRVCGTDDLQGPAGAQLIEQFNFKTVYIVDNSDTYGKSLADLFEVSFISAGGKVLGHDETTLTQRDYTTVVTHIKRTHPDAVYFGSTGVELGTLRKQMAEAGIGDIPYFGGDAMNEEVFPKIAGPAAHNSYFTVMTPNGLQLTTPQAKHFTKAFERAYHSEPLPYDAGSYAAGQVEVAAIREALETNDTHRPTREQVRANIAATHDLASAIGSITFNRVGDIRDPYVSYYTFDETSKKTFLKQFVYRTE